MRGFNGGRRDQTESTGSPNFQPLYTVSGDCSGQLDRNGVFEKSRGAGNACQSENKKKSPTARAGLFCFPGRRG